MTRNSNPRVGVEEPPFKIRREGFENPWDVLNVCN